jgi:hypothetical protein
VMSEPGEFTLDASVSPGRVQTQRTGEQRVKADRIARSGQEGSGRRCGPWVAPDG